MDGRTQLPVNDWARKEYGVEYVDTITEPGPNGILSRGDEALTRSIRDRVLISVEKHGSKVIIVVGHHDCAGNPGPREQQVRQVEDSLRLIGSWGLGAELVGVYVDGEWQVERL